jgi:hypothetical protein
MATPYSKINLSFLDKISDSYLSILKDADLESQLLRYLNSAISKFTKCKTDLSQRDDDGFLLDLSDTEIDILSNLMVVEWLRPQINNLELIKQALGSRDFSLNSQANHLKELRELQRSSRSEVRQLIVDYSYSRNSLEDLEL